MTSAWPPAHLLLCLVTERRALAAALGVVDATDALLRQVSGAVQAGIDLVHLRERDLSGGALRELAAACVERTAGSATRLVVNDRADVALAAGADGVHLRGDSMAAAAVRGLLPGGALVGRAVRSAREARDAGAVDYLVAGTVFPTPSKPGSGTIIGTAGLAQVARAASVPVLAIGGASEATLPDIARTGAAGLAGIRLFFDAGVAPGAFARRVTRWREAFDMHRSIS